MFFSSYSMNVKFIVNCNLPIIITFAYESHFIFVICRGNTSRKMTRVTRSFGDTMMMHKDVVSADVIFASLRFPTYKIGSNNQIMDDPKVLSMKEVVARETAQLLEQQKRLSVRDLASKFEKGLAAAAKLSEEVTHIFYFKLNLTFQIEIINDYYNFQGNSCLYCLIVGFRLNLEKQLH